MDVMTKPLASAALAENADPLLALDEAIAKVRGQLGDAPITTAMLFAASEYEPEFPRLIAAAHERLGRPLLIGCSGEGVIGPRRESERQPALSLVAQALPDATFRAAHLDIEEIGPGDAEALRKRAGVAPADVRGWLLLADPFSVEGEALIERFSVAYPGTTLLGGMASSLGRRTSVFLNDRVYDRGVVGLAITAPYALRAVVSQGASPIGEVWTITGAHANIVETIGGRPAYDVLVETIHALPEAQAARAAQGPLVGLAIDEYRAEFGRGDFLIRNVVGYNPETRVIAVNALPRAGQTIQFQFRDAGGAGLDLRALLRAEREQSGDPVAAILCSCNGRGTRMFDEADHDALALDETFAGLPVAGLFCAGEIGPVGGRSFVHGFTASIGLITRKG